MHAPFLGPRPPREVPLPPIGPVARPGAALLIAFALGGCASAPAAAPDAGCRVDLLVQFSPSVARPTSNTFLQSLVQGSGYDLRYVRSLGTTRVLRMTGLAPSCDAGVARLRADPAVHSLQFDEKNTLPRVPPRTESR